LLIEKSTKLKQANKLLFKTDCYIVNTKQMFFNDSSNSVESSNITQEDFFKGVDEHQPVKTLILCLGLTLINILLLYSSVFQPF
jgi:hypothetical protein